MPQVPGNTIPGAGGYGSYPGNYYRDRYDWLLTGELAHLGASGLVTTASKRNPYLWVATTAVHWISHQDPYRIADIFGILPPKGVPGPLPARPFTPGGGGPRDSLTSTNPPPSVEEVGRMVTSGGRSRKSCPPGYRWNGRRCVRKD